VVVVRILVIEDEQRIAQAIKIGLEQEKYAVDLEYDGEDGYHAAEAGDYDLVILDIMMPGLDGITVCKKLRDDKKQMPILILTARSQTKDIVKGLQAGADDYLAKPFEFEELIARVKALLRRPKKQLSNILVVGDLTLDTVYKTVARANKEIQLSSKEYALLEYLMRHQGRVLSKEILIEHVWDFDSDVLPNTVEVYMTYLRQKIDKPFNKPLLHTIRGFGYKITTGKS
jgi:DNA-binding response OmpR family regulator